MQVQVLFRAGIPPILQVAEPGVHGEVVTGTQGIGVNTPRAAAVAEATDGLAIDVHIPNVGMFFIGTKSVTFAAGLVAITCFSGVTTSADGASPNEHISAAPAVTCEGISRRVDLFLRLRLDGAVVGFRFAEILHGVLQRFFGVCACFSNIRCTFAVKSKFFSSVHRLPALRFSINANSSSIR